MGRFLGCDVFDPFAVLDSDAGLVAEVGSLDGETTALGANIELEWDPSRFIMPPPTVRTPRFKRSSFACWNDLGAVGCGGLEGVELGGSGSSCIRGVFFSVGWMFLAAPPAFTAGVDISSTGGLCLFAFSEDLDA